MKNLVELSKHLHFIGIGGAGMSALAEYAIKLGFIVSGSDIAESEVIERLKAYGIKISKGHQDSLSNDVKTVVISSAINKNNPELKWAETHGCQIVHRSDLLNDFAKEKKVISVAGTHGKTTTTALISHLLSGLDCKPSAIIGGVMKGTGTSSLFGTGEYIVIEADESDGSFLKYKPFIGVLTNVALDHMEYFKDQQSLEKTFSQYLENIDEEGCAVVGWENPLSRKIGSEYKKNRLTYGFLIGSEVRAINYLSSKGMINFTAVVEREQYKCKMRGVGKYNVENALCALAVIRSLELDMSKATKALETFQGVERRFSMIHEEPSIRIIDDYAHNPGKLSSCVKAIKESWPNEKLIVVFQPHRFSRMETVYNELMGSFKMADQVIVLPVYSAGEISDKKFDPKSIAKDIERVSLVKSIGFESKEQVLDELKKMVKENIASTTVLTLGAGDVWRVATMLKEHLKNGKK